MAPNKSHAAALLLSSIIMRVTGTLAQAKLQILVALIEIVIDFLW